MVNLIYHDYKQREKYLFSIIKVYRWYVCDGIHKEKNFLIISSEDTKYDSDVFLLDLKLENNLLAQRKWQDDFDKAPTGIFSRNSY
jgi:hypothetical protein